MGSSESRSRRRLGELQRRSAKGVRGILHRRIAADRGGVPVSVLSERGSLPRHGPGFVDALGPGPLPLRPSRSNGMDLST